MLTVFQGVKLRVFMILNLFYNVNFLKMWWECTSIAVTEFSSIYFTQAWCSFKSFITFMFILVGPFLSFQKLFDKFRIALKH